MWETQVQSLSQEDPLEKEMATHSSTLAWRIPWREEPGRLQSMGSQRVGHDWVTSLTQSMLEHLSTVRKSVTRQKRSELPGSVNRHFCSILSKISIRHLAHAKCMDVHECIVSIPNGSRGFPGISGIRNPPANAGDMGSIPESGRSPGDGNATYPSILAWEIW